MVNTADPSQITVDSLRTLLCFDSKAPWLILPEGSLVQIAIDVTIAALPGTAPWFEGVIHYAGNFVPIFDLDGFCNDSGNVSDDRKFIVVINPGQHAIAMRCAKLPQLGSVLAVEDTSADTLGKLSAFTGQLRTTTAGIAVEFDPRRWLASVANSLTHR